MHLIRSHDARLRENGAIEPARASSQDRNANVIKRDDN
jgi:hypothetical protein